LLQRISQFVKKSAPLLVFGFLLLGLLEPTFADSSNPLDSVIPCYGGSCDSAEVSALPQSDVKSEFLPLIARLMIYGASFASMLAFFYAGFLLVTQYGNEEKVTSARSIIIWGVVGMAVTAAAYVIIRGVLELDIFLF